MSMGDVYGMRCKIRFLNRNPNYKGVLYERFNRRNGKITIVNAFRGHEIEVCTGSAIEVTKHLEKLLESL
ncbi:hypothetical protein VPHK469_0153 [Vibrio phage K469]